MKVIYEKTVKIQEFLKNLPLKSFLSRFFDKRFVLSFVDLVIFIESRTKM